jgi:hypothetical protein
MNRANRQRLFAALVGAIVGAGLGRSIEPLSQGPSGMERFRSQPYQRLYRAYPRVGAGLGALAAVGLATIAQAQRRRFRQQKPRSAAPSRGWRP